MACVVWRGFRLAAGIFARVKPLALMSMGWVPWQSPPRGGGVCQLNMGMIGFDSERRSRGSEPRNAAMISLTTCRKKIIANQKRDSFALAA